VESEYTIHNYSIVLAIFVVKIIKVGGNLMKFFSVLMKTILAVFLRHGVYLQTLSVTKINIINKQIMRHCSVQTSLKNPVSCSYILLLLELLANVFR